MDRIIVLFLGLPLSIAIIVYRYHLKQFTGDIAWAEQYLGAGGTYNFFILLGLGVFILTLMYALGTLQEFMNGPLGPIFGAQQAS